MAELWVVREIAGIEESSEEYSTIALSFEFIHDYAEDASTLSKDAIKSGLRKAKPDLTEHSIGHTAGQIYRFARKMQIGDFVLTPIRPPSMRMVLMGKIVGPYVFKSQYAAGYREYPGICAHTRRVQWCKRVSRDEFSDPFQSTISSNRSVFSAKKHLENFLKVLRAGISCLPGSDGD